MPKQSKKVRFGELSFIEDGYWRIIPIEMLAEHDKSFVVQQLGDAMKISVNDESLSTEMRALRKQIKEQSTKTGGPTPKATKSSRLRRRELADMRDLLRRIESNLGSK
jgi:hypothetical protein